MKRPQFEFRPNRRLKLHQQAWDLDTLWAWFKSQILMPRCLVFRSDSLYYQALQPAIEQGKKPPRKKKMRGGNKPAGEKTPVPKPEKEDAYH